MLGGPQVTFYTYLAWIKEGIPEHTQTFGPRFPIFSFTTFIPFNVKAEYIDSESPKTELPGQIVQSSWKVIVNKKNNYFS